MTGSRPMTGDLIERKAVADILAAAAALIEPEGRWTQGAASKSKTGLPDDDNRIRRDAVCWCAWGAILKASGETRIVGASERAKAAGLHVDLLVGTDVTVWNDRPERTQAEVVAALRAAAEKARTAASSSSPATEGGV